MDVGQLERPSLEQGVALNHHIPINLKLESNVMLGP